MNAVIEKALEHLREHPEDLEPGSEPWYDSDSDEWSSLPLTAHVVIPSLPWNQDLRFIHWEKEAAKLLGLTDEAAQLLHEHPELTDPRQCEEILTTLCDLREAREGSRPEDLLTRGEILEILNGVLKGP